MIMMLRMETAIPTKQNLEHFQWMQEAEDMMGRPLSPLAKWELRLAEWNKAQEANIAP